MIIIAGDADLRNVARDLAQAKEDLAEVQNASSDSADEPGPPPPVIDAVLARLREGSPGRFIIIDGTDDLDQVAADSAGRGSSQGQFVNGDSKLGVALARALADRIEEFK